MLRLSVEAGLYEGLSGTHRCRVLWHVIATPSTQAADCLLCTYCPALPGCCITWVLPYLGVALPGCCPTWVLPYLGVALPGLLEVYGHWLSLYTSGVLIDYLLPINSATNSHF